MGILSDILKEIPLSAVLRERLADQETKMAHLEKVGVEKDALIAKLTNDLNHLQSQINKIQHDVKGTDECPYCKKISGVLEEIKADKVFGDLGVKQGYYKCSNSNCGKAYEKEMPGQG